jgi:hypothetical protein
VVFKELEPEGIEPSGAGCRVRDRHHDWFSFSIARIFRIHLPTQYNTSQHKKRV